MPENIFSDQMKQQYGSLSAFWRQTEIRAYMSYESVRQILFVGKQPSLHHLVIIMSALRFPARDIVQQLRAHGDTYIWPLLSLNDDTDTSLHRLARDIGHMGPETNAAFRQLVRSIIEEEHISIDAQNWERMTPMMVAARSGHDDTAIAFLDLGASHTIEDIKGWTMLEYGDQGDCRGLLRKIRALDPTWVLDRFIESATESPGSTDDL